MRSSLSQTTPSPTDLEQLIAMRETQRSLKDRLELMDKAISEIEGRIIAQIDSGADFSRFGYSIAIQESSRRFPAWKEHFIGRLGKAEADAVLEATPATIYRKLVIR